MTKTLPVALLLLLPVLLAAAAAQPPAGGIVHEFRILVDGEVAHGLIAQPTGNPDTLVVVAHGLGHNAESHRGHLEALAERGAVAVAMDYRGPRAGFPLAAGAADTLAATEHLIQRHEPETVILFSVSMGTAVAGMVLAEAPGTFDWWVSSEGLANLAETWAEAKAVSPVIPLGARVASAIENETGGTPASAPEAYAQRSAVVRVPEFQRLDGAILIHAPNDGLVPYNQGRELVETLRGHGLAADFYTVLRGEPGGEGTSLTGHAGLQVDGLAGHGTESDDDHTLTRISWELTYRLVEGDPTVLPSVREFIVDRDLP